MSIEKVCLSCVLPICDDRSKECAFVQIKPRIIAAEREQERREKERLRGIAISSRFRTELKLIGMRRYHKGSRAAALKRATRYVDSLTA